MNHSRENPALAPNVISRIHQLSEEFLKSELDQAGVPGLVASHGHILGCLYAEDHLPMWRIAAIIKRRKSTLTVLADKLEQAGYIRRETSPEDSRVRQISLTPRGLAAKEVFLGITERLQSRFWHGFSEEEKRQAMRYLARMEANFQGAAADGPTDSPDGASNETTNGAFMDAVSPDAPSASCSSTPHTPTKS